MNFVLSDDLTKWDRELVNWNFIKKNLLFFNEKSTNGHRIFVANVVVAQGMYTNGTFPNAYLIFVYSGTIEKSNIY